MSRHFGRPLAVRAGIFTAALAVAGVAAGAGQPAPADAAPILAPTSIDPPAALGSTSPTVAAEGATTVAKGHQILATWLEPGQGGGRLMFARLSEQEWSQPITIAEPVSTPEPVDRPSLTVIETQGVRRTLIARTGDVVARSGDGGRTWTRLPAPELPSASFVGGEEGAYAFWLSTLEDGTARLLGTRVLAGETLLDARVSAAADTSAAMTWDGPIVTYRDDGEDGARDIALVRRQDAAWTPPQRIHAETWRPLARPEAGPQIAALRRQVAVVWYTESARVPQVLVAFSSDAGRTFGEPVEVASGADGQAPLGAVDVTLDDAGNALVLWLAASAGAGADASLNLARVSPGGTLGEPLVLDRGPAGRFSGSPQIARADTRVAVTWTEGVPGRVRAMDVPLASLPALGSRPAASRLAAAAGGAGTAKPYAGRGRVGEAFPELELQTLGGDSASVPAIEAGAVLLNLWATWCLPCLAEMPVLAALEARHGPQGLVVVGVSVDDAAAIDKVREFVAGKAIPFAIWLDPEMSLYRALRVKSLPATFLIGRDGRIVLRRNQTIEAGDAELEQAIRAALRRP